MESILIQARDRALELANNNTFEYYYFGALKKAVFDEFSFPYEWDEYVEFVSSILNGYIDLNKKTSNRTEEIRIKIKEIKELLEGKRYHKDRDLEYNCQRLEKETEKLNTSIHDLESELIKIENEINIQQLTNGYQVQDLLNRKARCHEYILSKTEEISKYNAEIERIKAQISKIRNENLASEFDELEKEELELRKKPISLYEHYFAVAELNFIFFKEKAVPIKLDDNRIILLDEKERVNLIQKINFKFHSSVYIPDWRGILIKLFDKQPDFASACYLQDKYKMFERPADCDFFIAAFWMSMRHAIQKMPNLETRDGKIFLWITNVIFCEIKIWQNQVKDFFIGIYQETNYQNKSIKSQAYPAFIDGYTSSAFYIPKGFYLTSPGYSFEFTFSQSALLQTNSHNSFYSQDSSDGALVDYEKSLEDDD